MCGIVGFMGGATPRSGDDAVATLKKMAGAIVPRGPDSDGYWSEAEAGVHFAHRRLAIVDLSPAGAQPMESASARYVITYNGEIYNHLALREGLEHGGQKCYWRGHSDTETLLACIEEYGVAGALTRAVGMFAFALWDRETRCLTLARDRLGEKPLYYGWQGTGEDAVFLFGSELKALRAHHQFAAPISRGAISLLMRHNYIPAPYSIYEGISKLDPGTFLTLETGQRIPSSTRYWSAIATARDGAANLFGGTDANAVDQLESLLLSSIRQQMMADVPLGAFLSGGVDSSTVVALMQAQSSQRVKTFTIGFGEAAFNEADHAKAVAQHLGTEHTELYVDAKAALAVIPALPEMYDEPFADSSQIPTFLVSQLARQHVTVSLSGDGGDELFCGYERYLDTARAWQRLNRVPAVGRRLLKGSLTSLSPAAWNALAGCAKGVGIGARIPDNIGDKLHKGAALLDSGSSDELYRRYISLWPDPAALVLGGEEPATAFTGNLPDLRGLSETERMMAIDLVTYLPDDILAKVDRASMAVSLESRVPFLDHRIVEFAWQLPQSMKVRGEQTKWALRQVLYRHVPRELIERDKMGFGVPIGAWLRGPLRDWASALLDSQRLKREGFFRHELVSQKWQEHLSGRRNWQHHLWSVLMFQAWLEQQSIRKAHVERT